MNWNATTYFEDLTSRNKLAVQNNFVFCRVSSLEGFEEALNRMQSATAFVCVSEVDDGTITIDNTPHASRVKTVFLAMRHQMDNMTARRQCFETMHEVFRQFASKLLADENGIFQSNGYLDHRINFTEIPQYFFSGCACAYFQIKTNNYMSLAYNDSEWNESNA